MSISGSGNTWHNILILCQMIISCQTRYFPHHSQQPAWNKRQKFPQLAYGTPTCHNISLGSKILSKSLTLLLHPGIPLIKMSLTNDCLFSSLQQVLFIYPLLGFWVLTITNTGYHLEFDTVPSSSVVPVFLQLIPLSTKKFWYCWIILKTFALRN